MDTQKPTGLGKGKYNQKQSGDAKKTLVTYKAFLKSKTKMPKRPTNPVARCR